MIRIILVALCLYGAYHYWDLQKQKSIAEAKAAQDNIRLQDLHKVQALAKGSMPYVAVYGRNSCSLTSRMRKTLDEYGIPYTYLIIDEPETSDYIHGTMKAHGLDTSHYMLPVVEVNSSIRVSPEPSDIVISYKTGLAAAGLTGSN